MTTAQSSGCISIVRTLEGEEPLWVRRAWVGIILPHSPDPEENPATREFEVPQNEAIGHLECHNAEAARWWRARGYPKFGENFRFSKADAVLIGAATRQSTILALEGRTECCGG